MFLVGAYIVSMVFVNAFECDEASDAWSVEILLQGDGTCTDLLPVYFGQAGFNIASDLVILVLPIPVVWNLQMKRQKRIAVISISSIGSIAALASIIRIYALYLWSTDPDTPYQARTRSDTPELEQLHNRSLPIRCDTLTVLTSFSILQHHRPGSVFASYRIRD